MELKKATIIELVATFLLMFVFPIPSHQQILPPVALKNSRVRRATGAEFPGVYSDNVSPGCSSSSPVYTGYLNYFTSLRTCPIYSMQANPTAVADLLARSDANSCKSNLQWCGAGSAGLAADNNFGGVVTSLTATPASCPILIAPAPAYKSVDFKVVQSPSTPIIISFCYVVRDPTSMVAGFFGESKVTPIPSSVLSVPVNPETQDRACPAGYVAIPFVDVVSVANDCNSAPCEYTMFYCKNTGPLTGDRVGPNGYQGPAGLPGAPGQFGWPGPTGPEGYPGPSGIVPELTGPSGRRGDPGLVGLAGSKGDTGAPGCPGRDGWRGPPGRPASASKIQSIALEVLRELFRGY